ncbi:amidohydrolase [Paraliomyxa miuraensis]|uniref:amidohydrolase n=1 Tax=Paraliomyxa miuraensis TaxID=376150 RepID=UPI00225AD20C|nr:amidohydrolase [Paraliomyxa miuraensis]MCX4241509.1 amidohydrolase [Paraliomyxa miuraensis]
MRAPLPASFVLVTVLLGAPACRPTTATPIDADPPQPTSPASARPVTPEPREVVLPEVVGASPLAAEIDRLAAELEPAVVGYRRDLHEHPELGNREHRTARVIGDHLRAHGWSVRTGVAHTGLVAVLEGTAPGPVVALRAEMDALPVEEQTGLPFASKATASWRGQDTPVMHACGHDMHMAIAMGVAELLPRLPRRPGTVVILFQPAEEGAPEGEEGGAELMVAEGALAEPAPEVIFGLHVVPEPVGDVLYRVGPAMASADALRIVVKGKQTHGAYPWRGVDPVTVSAQIVLALQTIVTRQLDTTKSASVISVGSISGGVRGNIIPDEVEMIGTIRTFDAGIRQQLHERIEHMARLTAEASGATAEVTIDLGYPVVDNDPMLLSRMLPTLQRVAGPGRLRERQPVLGAEDFAFYQQRIPGLFFFLGIVPEGTPVAQAPSNHSPRFLADEAALGIGVRAMSHLVADYLFAAQPDPRP